MPQLLVIFAPVGQQRLVMDAKYLISSLSIDFWAYVIPSWISACQIDVPGIHFGFAQTPPIASSIGISSESLLRSLFKKVPRDPFSAREKEGRQQVKGSCLSPGQARRLHMRVPKCFDEGKSHSRIGVLAECCDLKRIAGALIRLGPCMRDASPFFVLPGDVARFPIDGTNATHFLPEAVAPTEGCVARIPEDILVVDSPPNVYEIGAGENSFRVVRSRQINADERSVVILLSNRGHEERREVSGIARPVTGLSHDCSCKSVLDKGLSCSIAESANDHLIELRPVLHGHRKHPDSGSFFIHHRLEAIGRRRGRFQRGIRNLSEGHYLSLCVFDQGISLLSGARHLSELLLHRGVLIAHDARLILDRAQCAQSGANAQCAYEQQAYTDGKTSGGDIERSLITLLLVLLVFALRLRPCGLSVALRKVPQSDDGGTLGRAKLGHRFLFILPGRTCLAAGNCAWIAEQIKRAHGMTRLTISNIQRRPRDLT